jgi:integrase
LKEGASPATVDQDLGKVKTMIRKAYDDEIVTDATLVKFGKVRKKLKKGSDVRTRILSRDEFDSFMALSQGQIKDMVAIAYYTGMRRGEILSLTWDKVDLKNRAIHLDAADTKDQEKRDIPVCEELYKILVSMPGRIQSAESNNNLFNYKGRAIKGEIRATLKKACKVAGIKYGRREDNGFTFHDLRHTFNTNMRKAGVPESVIMEITGHSTREMFDRYNTIDHEDRKNAAKTLDRFLSIGPQNGPQASEFAHSNKDDAQSSL